jgi:hypothetical protein
LTVADIFLGGGVILIADFETTLCQNGWFDAYSLDALRRTAGLLSIRTKKMCDCMTVRAPSHRHDGSGHERCRTRLAALRHFGGNGLHCHRDLEPCSFKARSEID